MHAYAARARDGGCYCCWRGARPLVITSESTTRYVYTQIAETRGNLCERGRYPEGTKRKRNPEARAVCSIRKIRTVLCILARRYLLSQEYLAR